MHRPQTKPYKDLKTRGEFMRYAREKRGYSMKLLSEFAGVAENTLYQWERDLNNPTLDGLLLVVDVLGITIDEYIGHTVQEKRAG